MGADDFSRQLSISEDDVRHYRKIAARKMIDLISKIYDYGLKVASGTLRLRCIDSKIGLYELKGLTGLIER